MNTRIADYNDYLNELNHLYCISSGDKKLEIERQINKELSDLDKAYEYEKDQKGEVILDDDEHDHDYDLLEEERQLELNEQRYENEVYYSFNPE